MQADTLIIATRESRLALWQARHVQHLLSTTWNRPVELLGMTTRGDQILDRALSKVGGKGLFVKELEVAMEEGRAHLAVHSLKDVPMEMPEGFVLAAVLEREDPRDAWVSSRFQDVQALPQGGRVGTSSLRRMVQLRQLRPDLQILPLRGNLDTRLRKLDEGEFDGIVLAAAGLRRLGLADRIRSVFDTDILLPAAGQGALGIEVRLDAAELASAFQGLIDVPTWLAVHAERAVSRTLGGSCSVPLAAFAEWQADGQLRVRAALGHPGSGAAGTWPLLRAETLARVESVQQAEALGVSVAQELLAMGGRAYLDAATEPSASA